MTNKLLYSACVVLSINSTQLLAQSSTPASIERITVVSDFRQANLEQLAGSATIIDADTINQRQSQHLDDILTTVPNVNFASGASRGRFVQIRGIGERSQFSEPSNPSVSFEFDDINLTGQFALATPFDVKQIEVLRGPQATEFGVGALAGAIRFVSVAPGAVQGNTFLLSLAEKNTMRVGAAYGADINDNIGYRASWLSQRSDGDVKNTFLNRDDTNNINEDLGRLALAAQINDSAKLIVNYRYYNIDNGYDAFSLENDNQTRSDEPGFDRNKTHAVSVRSENTFKPLTLFAIASHVTSDLAYGYDEDWTYTGFAPPNSYTSFDAYFRDIDVTTLDLRAISNQPINLFNQQTDWVFGGFYRQRDEDLLREYTFASSDFVSQFQPDQYALYGRLDFSLSDKLSTQIGLRLERSELDYNDNSGFVERSSDNLLGGKWGLSYQLANGTLYSSVSRGYKLGGFNPDERVNAASRLYQPEYNWNYELGVKTRLFDGLGNVRVAAFYMEREDAQISDFDVISRDNGSSDFIDIIGNADVGTNKGFEVETQWQLTERWSLSANMGYLDASFGRYTQADGTVIEEREQAQAPKYTANLVSQVFFDMGIDWRLEIDAKDDHFFSDGHDVRSRGYALVNSSINWNLDSWTLQLWAKNIFDREYTVRGFGGFSNDPRDYNPDDGDFGYEQAQPYLQFGNGRRVGVTIQYQF